MPKVTDISDRMPHIIVQDVADDVHIIPKRFFEDVARCDIPITDLEDWQLIIPVIVGQWLAAIESGK